MISCPAFSGLTHAYRSTDLVTLSPTQWAHDATPKSSRLDVQFHHELRNEVTMGQASVAHKTRPRHQIPLNMIANSVDQVVPVYHQKHFDIGTIKP